MNTAVMFSSASDSWATPQALFDQYDAQYHFTLDAAADETNHKCAEWLGPGGVVDDALTVDWIGYRVWLNPPYSRAAEFLKHAADQSMLNDVGSVVLLPSRTDTRWFHHYVWCAQYQKPYPWVKGVHFLKGRVKFVHSAMSYHLGAPIAANSAPFPSLLVVLNGDWN